MSCSTCRFWWQHENATKDDLGVCRRYAPRSRVGNEEVGKWRIEAEWPETGWDWWCGEYEADESDG